MSIEFANQTSQPVGNERLKDTYAIAVDVFSCMPQLGGIIQLEQIAEDLEEAPEIILAALDDLRHDNLLDCTIDDGVITVISKHETFLKEHLVLEAIKR